MVRRLALLALAAAMILAACGDDDTATSEDTTTTTTPSTSTTADTTTTDAGPAMAPAALVFETQVSDGTSIAIASVTLPSPGFIAVHSNNGGEPGPVIGHSDLLPAGTTDDVVIALDTPLSQTDLLFPMVHIDVDGDGVYEFGGGDNTDAPAQTADGAVAVTGAEVTVPGPVPDASGIVFEAQPSDGVAIVIASVALPQPGFVAIHSNAGGSPGPVIGHSELIDAGTWTDVVVILDTPLAETDLLFPMIHLDVDGDGIYEFGGGDNTDTPGVTADGSVAVAGAEVTVEAPEIEIEGFDFGEPITVAVGVEVLVHNHDGVPHTWTSVDGVFDSGSMPNDAEFRFTFDEAGEYDFFCSIHPSMTGTITVTE